MNNTSRKNSDFITLPSNYRRLRGLDWAIGEWAMRETAPKSTTLLSSGRRRVTLSARLRPSLTALAVAATFVFISSWSSSRAADETSSSSSTRKLAGCVQAAGKPIAGATVTLYAASTAAPAKLAEGKTDDQGAFKLDAGPATGETVLYLVAKGGTPKGAASKAANDAIALLAVLGSASPNTVTVNEFTTVASVWTSAQFLEGDVLSGHSLGLRIA